MKSRQRDWPNMSRTKATPRNMPKSTGKIPQGLNLTQRAKATEESWEQKRWPSSGKSTVGCVLKGSVLQENLVDPATQRCTVDQHWEETLLQGSPWFLFSAILFSQVVLFLFKCLSNSSNQHETPV